MLLIKCPQCNRSYRLAESLYQRKAAGFGVVITCRHCKTQIHVDEGALGDASAEAPDPSAFDVDEVTPPSREVHAAPPRALASTPESQPPPSSGPAMPLVVKPPAQGPVSDHEEAVTLPPAAPVALKSAAAPSPVAV